MNLYFQELRYSRRSLLYWIVCQAALICMGYLEFAMVFKGNADVAEVMKQLPPSFMVLMGIPQGIDFSNVSDFFLTMSDFGFYVMAAYACLLGLGMISREETGQTLEFLLSKPVSRQSVLLWKCAAGLTNCLFLGLVTIVVTLPTFGTDPDGNLWLPTLVWGGTSLLMQAVYFLAGAMFGASCSKPAQGTALNLLFLFGTIMMSRVISFLGLTGPVLCLGVKYYFPMVAFVQSGTFGVWPWVMCAVWICLFSSVAFLRFQRRDF